MTRGATFPARIQQRLARTYALDEAPAVDDFIRPTDDDGAREVLMIRHAEGEIEVALHLPRGAIARGRRGTFDEVCQIVEGVSHFLHVAERARRELPTTQLELELQAEVDKYVLLVHGDLEGEVDRPDEVPLRRGPRSAPRRRFEPERAARIRAFLFERVTFADPPGTETGDRYRIANDLAARFAGRLEAQFARRGRYKEMLATLRRFYAAGQADKIALARAA